MDKSEKSNNLEFIALKQEWLDFAKDVDEFFKKNYPDYNFDAGKVLKSIFYNLKNEDSQDPDRVQTIASKIRAFLYPIFSKEISKKGSGEWVKILNIAQSIGTKFFFEKEKPLLLSRLEEIKNLYSRISDLDHYCIHPQFEEFKNDKNKCLNYSLEKIRTDLEELKNLFPTIKKVNLILHEIAKFFNNKMRKGSLSKEKDLQDLTFLMNLKQFNFKDFFYRLIDKIWIDWLFKNGFFEVLKQKAEDTSSYSYKTPELNYLLKIAEKAPESVAKVILKTPISEKNFNPEVIDRFIFITSNLTSKEIKKIIPKIYKEKWLYLMRDFSLMGFDDFEKILKKLLEKKEYQSIVILAKSLFEVNKAYKGDPFYFKNFEKTNIFDYLSKIEDKKAIFELIKFFINDVIKKLIDKNDKADDFFSYKDKIPLFQINIFDCQIKNKNYFYPYTILENIFCVITTLSKKLELEKIKKLFNLIKKISLTFNTYKLKLYFLTLYPKTFKKEIIKEIKTKKLWSLIYTPDCQSFLNLNLNYLSANQKSLLKNYKTEPLVIISYEAKRIEDLSNINQAILNGLTIAQIVEKLKTDWSPLALEEFNKKQADFFRRYTPDGLFLEIKANIEKRFQEYIENAHLFFDKKKLHPHYTYKFLYSIESILKEQKVDFSKINFDNLFVLFENIKNAGFLPEVKQEIGFYTGWVASWRGVYTALSDLLRQLLVKDQRDQLKINFKKYRQKILETIKFLLESPYPDEKEDKESKRPFDLAINTSSRGRSFEVLVYFIIADGKKLASDVKKIYKNFVEKEKTMALYWLFGRHLAYFYYRNQDFIRKIVKEKILKKKNQDLYFAFWEGILSTSLYEEIFFEFKDDYNKLIQKNPKDYTKREYLVTLYQGIGIHLGLAFVYYEWFDKNKKLFKNFWQKELGKAHFYFIKTLGEQIFEKKESLEAIKARGVDIKKLKERIKDFCQWLIEQHKVKEDLKAFSSWINFEVDFFDKKFYLDLIKNVLEITEGELYIDYKLEDNLDKIVAIDKEKAFDIIRLFYLNKAKKAKEGKYVRIDEKIVEVFKVLYEHKKTKEKTVKLINDLMETAGDFGNLFWILEEKVLKY